MSETLQFGAHSFGDMCPNVHNLSTLKGCVDLMVGETEPFRWFKAYGPLRGLQSFQIVNKALSHLQEGVQKGVTEGDSLATFQYPNVFNADDYPLQTVLRLQVLCHEFSPPESMLYSRHSKLTKASCSNVQILGDNHLAYIKTGLGVLWGPPKGKNSRIIMFWGSEEDILKGHVSYTSGTEKIDFEDWVHVVMRCRVFGGEYYDEQFSQSAKVEILEMGKAIKEKDRVILPQISGLQTKQVTS